MIKMAKKSFYLITIPLLFGFVQSVQATCGNISNNTIQNIINTDRQKYHIPATELSLVCPGEAVSRDFFSGTVTLDGKQPIDPHPTPFMFQIGSETKTFTAVIILQLEAEGRLSINDPIINYLPWVPSTWKKISIKQLLYHTSGIPSYSDDKKFMNKIMSDPYQQFSARDLVDVVINKRLILYPKWHYSNTNTVLAGMIIEAVTGKTLHEEMSNRLFKPLGMLDTYYLPSAYPPEILQHMAHGYWVKKENVLDTTTWNMSWANAAGAIISTAHDNALWLKQLLIEQTLLPIRQQQEMMALINPKNGKPLPPESNKSGIGLEIYRDLYPTIGETWSRGGETPGFLAKMYWLKLKNIGLTIATSADGDDGAAEPNDGIQAIINDVVSYIWKS
jgi:D-alanyl-D-alanine carboxypeptidase